MGLPLTSIFELDAAAATLSALGTARATAGDSNLGAGDLDEGAAGAAGLTAMSLEAVL